MLFPTATFAIFFLIVLPLSWLAMPKVHRWRPFIIVASYVFYSWWDWRFIFLLAGCTLWNQVFAVRIHRASTQAQRKALLTVALIGALRRGNESVIGVLLGSPSIWTDMDALMSAAFNRLG